ncbi:MAG: hypothetical protein KDD42_09455, partial [Bdellovibrionales bacterium]|nr:hypothetical protein [Bdellovibrionales bacterium]
MSSEVNLRAVTSPANYLDSSVSTARAALGKISEFWRPASRHRFQPKLASSRCKRSNRFKSATARIKESPFYASTRSSEAPHGYFEGRHIIGSCNKIQGGVYIGVIPHEAVVIDEKHGTLADIYHSFVMKFVAPGGARETLEEKIFFRIVQFTKYKLPLNEEKVRQLAFKSRIGPDRKTALDFYIKEQAGAARHQVLLAGYLLQR